MLPDVDLRLPLVPHRGPTHTVWFALAVAAGGGAVGWTAGAPAGPLAAAGLAAILRDEGAEVLTVYDANGNYGHPDHIQVHRVGVRAVGPFGPFARVRGSHPEGAAE
jgi:LmbE family N-acetylglucosaminyl deacetylase